ncbi:hypothetical protein AT959_08635 [Dechloromonas denitrificans]|uniref:Uncharacterized protein n=1 Tax=Dechloromonas denitrificans TaxID=281362 RepID=A0A133XIS0_9RHOO|nr:hypothetical protein [Dechloromonas denitrificans]KXB30786.1 hypothetical protein AT959_08635 [Dechloromonas denitrificans]
MAAQNFITNATKQAAMLADLNDAAKAINQGATGFLFAAQMPDGSIQWMAGGELAGYDNATAVAAMQLYIEAQRAALRAA